MKNNFLQKSLTFTSGSLVILAACNQQQTENEKPNVVLIFADDLGYGDLGCYGHPTILTPHIDNMAEEGIRFTSFYAAASVCTPSRAALLTGRYPIRNLPNNIGPESKHGLPLSEITIADILKEQDYQTMAIGKWHLGHGTPALMPTSRGFDHYYGLLYSNDMILPWCPWLTEDDKLMLYKDTTAIEEIGFDQDSLTIMYTQQAIQFITSNQDNPFFLYLAHSMPHLPISTAESFRGKSTAGLYGDVVQTLDWSTGEILKTLQELNLDEKTLVVFTSDNGPWQNLPDRMLQRGVERWYGGSAGLLRGAKATTYEGGLRVPGIIRWPGKVPPSRVSNQIVSTMDLFATITEICGGKLPDDRTIDGKNIWSHMTGESDSPRETMYYHLGTNLQAFRKDNWKIRYTKQDSIQLFELNLDPSEKYNRAGEFPEVVEGMMKDMKEFADETGGEMWSY